MNELFLDIHVQPTFTCSYCDSLVSHQWRYIIGPVPARPKFVKGGEQKKEYDPYKDYFEAIIECTCNSCKSKTYWIKSTLKHEKQIHPVRYEDFSPPHKDMPDEIKKTYLESGSVISLSLGSSAALARLTLEDLLKYLGYKDGNLYKKIEKLCENTDVSSVLKDKLDIVRKIGNKGAHVGSISFQEKPEVPKLLLKIINDIVDELITKPNTLEELQQFIDS